MDVDWWVEMSFASTADRFPAASEILVSAQNDNNVNNIVSTTIVVRE